MRPELVVAWLALGTAFTTWGVLGSFAVACASGKRDEWVARCANVVLRLASNRYQSFVRGAIEYGTRSAARDQEEGRESPPDWRGGERDPYPRLTGGEE